MFAMSAYLNVTCPGAQGCPAPAAEDRVLGADSSAEPSQPYVPQQPAEDGGFIELLTSTQTLVAIIVALIAVVLLVLQLWPGRRDAQGVEEEREEAE